jgi:hypothetical protein
MTLSVASPRGSNTTISASSPFFVGLFREFLAALDAARTSLLASRKLENPYYSRQFEVHLGNVGSNRLTWS